MERRLAKSTATRAEIVEAAMAAYREQGIRATSMQEVARRADVAPNTVLNHFPTPAALTAAVIERIAESLDMPDERIFVGARSRSARLRRLVDALFALYERSTDWFLILRPQYDDVPALRDAEDEFLVVVQRLYALALGSVQDDATVRGTLFGLTSPATLNALRVAGLTTAEAASLVGDLVVYVADRAGRGTRTSAAAASTP